MPILQAMGNTSKNTSAGSGGSVLLRWLKFAAALALLPVCAGMSQGLFDVARAAWSRGGSGQTVSPELAWWFVGGAVVFTLFASLFWRLVVVYVFGHELVHALATWMCLGSVKSFRSGSSGGMVISSKTNVFIRLSPYFVPLYALLAFAVYFALDHWWQPLREQLNWLMAALGFFYAFHIGFTVWSLRQDQPDLKPDGWLFSLVVIYLSNLAVVALMMGFVLTGQLQFAWSALSNSSLNGWRHCVENYRWVIQFAAQSSRP